jgi:flagellar assembly protein FliH
MTARPKFLFDNDFAPGQAQKPNTVPLAQHQTAVAEAEARGYQNGMAAGKADSAADTDRRMAAALARAAASLETLTRGLGGIETRLETEAVEVAMAVAGKLASALLKREPLGEIAALAAECFRHLVGVPHVVVRINDALYEDARARLEEIARRCGFEGRLVVLAERDIEIGDCRVEWADGGAIRNRVEVEAAVAEAVERYLAVRRSGNGEFRSVKS